MGKAIKIIAALIAVLGTGVAGFVMVNVSAYDESMSKVYDVPLKDVQVSTDPVVLERGKHLAISIGSCAGNDCHGADLTGGKDLAMGPLGTFRAPNITVKGILADYSDAELARVLKHGIRKNGTSVVFMPSQDFAWWPDSDVVALISYLRSVPGVEKVVKPSEVGTLAKVLDRQDQLIADVARRIDHTSEEIAPAAAPTAAYGAYLAKLCMGCHGETLSGGPIPGAPPSMPVPLNLTPADDGLKTWAFEDFDKLMRQGLKRDGSKLDPFMPIDTMKHMNDVEMKALFAYLKTLPATPFGNR